MSAIRHAEKEMRIAGFSDEEIKTMQDILRLFFSAWDSGGAVWAMMPVLERCIAQKCLTPLQGSDDEWADVSQMASGPMWQNNRCSTVFKTDTTAYDIDTPGRPPITFPYWPENGGVGDPVIEIKTEGMR